MARNLVFVASANASAGSDSIPLDQIPADVVEEVEDAYKGLKSNPNGRIRAEFGSVAELNLYVQQVKSYCAQREAGAIRFRRSPTRGLAANVMDFRITDIKDDEPEVTTPVTPTQTAPAPRTGRK